MELKEPVLKDYEKELLRDIGSRTRYRSGEILYKAGDIAGKLYLVEKGLVGISSCTAKEDKMERISMPGELVGLSDIFLKSVRSCMAVALCDTVVLSVEKEALQDLMNDNPFLLSRIISILEYRGQNKFLREGSCPV